MLVTDIKRTVNKGTKNEKVHTGFYMDGYLKTNLDGIPRYIEKDWDCVGIVSGRGLVGVGKSTLAAQVAYYLAWRLAGGEMLVNEKNQVTGMVKPKKKVRFNLRENVVFSAEDLQDRAKQLYEKYGKAQVIVYDEGRQGLDSARAMESINKGMEDFFQECRFYNHVIIIVLPNFFKLHEDYAVARSVFLIDAFADREFNRGYFNFYNTRQKEYLYFFGKKKLGVTAKYNATKENFYGRFTRWLPYNKKEYEEAKKKAIEQKAKSRRERNLRLQRDTLVWAIRNVWKIRLKELKEKLHHISDITIAERTLRQCCERINDMLDRKKGSYYA
jgi:hypothetical protein